MSHWASIVCDRWNRRAEWDERREGAKPMPYIYPCPVCGRPSMKAVIWLRRLDGSRFWIRSLRHDSCHCLLTGVQIADLIRQAKKEALEVQE